MIGSGALNRPSETTKLLHGTPKPAVNKLKTFILPSVLSVLLITYFSLFATSAKAKYKPVITTIDHDPQNFQKLLRPISLQNASAVFNSIQGALRNKDSQIHPIGVSFIPAYIPQGTFLYHGNALGDIPEGPEWIAMDYEFSMGFASRWSRKPLNESHINTVDHLGHTRKRRDGFFVARDHASMFSFQVVKPLDRMLLLDGSSAAKTKTGEMDQQMILARVPTGDYVDERTAADRICEWGKPFGLDGYLRVEGGFEAVICDLHSDKLRVVSNESIPWYEELYENPNFTEEEPEHILAVDSLMGYDHIREGNIHNKRDGRILLDYRGFTTPLNKTWISTDTYKRRIHNVSEEIKENMISDLETFLTNGFNPYAGTDWQLITTEIVEKFGPMLKLLNDTFDRESTTDEEFDYNVRNLTLFSATFSRRFFDHDVSEENRYDSAVKHAVYLYSHPLQDIETESEILIWSSITKATEGIVKILFDTFLVGKDFMSGNKDISTTREKHQALKGALKDLLDTLQWSTYYTCSKKCAWDEVCYTPSWGPSPLGWGVASIGTYKDEDGTYRISPEEQCVSYRDVLISRRNRGLQRL